MLLEYLDSGALGGWFLILFWVQPYLTIHVNGVRVWTVITTYLLPTLSIFPVLVSD